MAIYRLGDLTPDIHPEAYVHPQATVIGDVTIGPEASVWPGAVLRGDYGTVVVGARSCVQDGTVVHAGPGLPTTIGPDCAIGHLAHLEGCTMERGSLVGSCAVVLHFAVVGTGGVVGANAVVANRTVVPAGALALGIPARIKEGAASADMIRLTVDAYVANGRRYRQELERLD
ncbi:MAG TPA: gamma carbonic anhydrase family protein [Acidimicrobiales bacterium]|jgi:carbonic anhydrase/acetyltransferase-like protein (isoleucine patch superfamily)|nr:gamma carbonic anhydrase family protein [Acidimicrobiales bacterium]